MEMSTEVHGNLGFKHSVPVRFHHCSIFKAQILSTAGQRVMRNRNNISSTLFNLIQHLGKFTNGGVFCLRMVQDYLKRIKGKYIQGSKIQTNREQGIKLIHLKTILEKQIVILGIVFSIAGNHDNWYCLGYLTKHEDKALVITAVIRIQVISNISIDHQGINLLFLCYLIEQIVKFDVSVGIYIQMRPVSQYDYTYLSEWLHYNNVTLEISASLTGMGFGEKGILFETPSHPQTLYRNSYSKVISLDEHL